MPKRQEIYNFIEARKGVMGQVKVRDLNNPVFGRTQARKWAKILRQKVKVGNFVCITRYGEVVGCTKRYK